MNTGCRNDVHPVFIYILGYQISLETPLNYTKYSFCIIACKQPLIRLSLIALFRALAHQLLIIII